VLENFGYRQILAVWQVSGVAHAWQGRQAVWGTMHREGFDTEPAEAAPPTADAGASAEVPIISAVSSRQGPTGRRTPPVARGRGR
jgi:hypothetical protein